MRANLDALRLGQPHGCPHVVEIAGMKAAGHIGQVDQRHHPGIVADPVQTEAFAHIAIDGNGHGPPGLWRAQTLGRLDFIVKYRFLHHRI